jgi:hypothetical protein
MSRVDKAIEKERHWGGWLGLTGKRGLERGYGMENLF